MNYKRLITQKVNRILRCFCLDVTATAAAESAGKTPVFGLLKRGGKVENRRKLLKRGADAGNSGQNTGEPGGLH